MTHEPLRHWLREHTLIEPSLLEGAGADSILAERLAAFGGSEPAYIAELARSSDEVDRVIAGIAVPETWLFRYPRSYELLSELLVRRLAARTGGASSTLRMLSIGCATGQEPYCIAMTAIHAGWPPDRVSVEGIDRNQDFLHAAAKGAYGPASVRTEIPTWAVPFLHRSGDGGAIAIDPAVRALVRFRRADATDPASLRAGGPYDVIFCRNLLIYLNTGARERLLDSICEALAPGGLLFVGHAEQTMRGKTPLRHIDAPHAFALERLNGLPLKAPSPSVPDRPREGPAPIRQARAPERPAPEPPRAPQPDSKDPTDSIETARDLADAGRSHEAETMIRAILARRGPSAVALELHAMIRLSLNDHDVAKRLFEQAVYLEPARAASLLQLALISERAGDTRRAASYWDRMRRAAPSSDKERTK